MNEKSYKTSFGNVTIKVSTDLMQSTANEILKKAEDVNNQFNNMIEIVQNTSLYWKGQTADNERKSLKMQSDNVADIVKELRSFVEKLQLMGQIYEKSEESSVNSANQLPTNIIA